MTRFYMCRSMVALSALLCMAVAPAARAITVTAGFADSNAPFNFVLNPGEYFTLDFGTAPINNPMLSNLESGQVITTFWVEVSPGVIGTDIGPDDTVLSCAIMPGGNCTDTDFGPVSIGLMESGGIISGNYLAPISFFNCSGPGIVPVVGAECGRDFSFLPRMLFDVTFNEPDTKFAYTLTVGNRPLGAIPEPASWVMMIAGFAITGGAMRARARSARQGVQPTV